MEALERTQNLFLYDAGWRPAPQMRLLQRGWEPLVVGQSYREDGGGAKHGTKSGCLLLYEGEYACAAATLGVPNVWMEGDKL